MSLMRGRLFAGALFVGVLFGQPAVQEITTPQTSGADDGYRYEPRIANRFTKKETQIAERNAEIMAIVQTLVVSGILEQLSTEDLTITWQT
jgi:hypothetical protein